MVSSAALVGPPPLAAREPAQPHARSVLLRLSKNRLAMLGVYAIVGLVALATFAPALASNQPFYWNAGHGPEFPWVASLFNRLLFENAVDVFFNVLLVLTPLVGGGVWVATSRARRHGLRVPVRGLLVRSGALVVLVFSLVSVERVGPIENPGHFTRKVVNYRVEQARLTALGQAAAAVFPPLPYSHRETDPASALRPPGREHWLGTDSGGRDVFSRMLFGTRISLTIGVVAVFIYVSLGTFLGALAGYLGGWVDNVISRLIEVMIAFPTFFLIVTLAALIRERSIFHVMLIIGLTNWTSVARLVRAEFLRQKSLDYVQAALATGLERRRIIFVHILPNAIAPALVAATFGMASAILIESSLSFLGVGDASVASWGETLNAGWAQQKLWLVLAPGFAIFFVVTIFNLVGEGIRDALDPKLRL